MGLRSPANLIGPFIAAALLLILLIALATLVDEGELLRTDPPSEAVNVVTSIHPITAIVQKVGGDLVDVSTILPAGSGAHLHETSPRDMSVAQAAECAIRIGGEMDSWVVQVFEVSDHKSHLQLLDAAEELSQQDTVDWVNPHIWLDPIIVRDYLVPTVERELADVDASNSQHYAENAETFQDELTNLHRELVELMVDIPDRGFISDHPAWTHFARRYELWEVGVIERSPGHEAGPREFANLLQEAEAAGVRVIVTTRGHVGASAQFIADELEASMLELDPIGTPHCEERNCYLQLLRFNATRLVQALSNGSSGRKSE